MNVVDVQVTLHNLGHPFSFSPRQNVPGYSPPPGVPRRRPGGGDVPGAALAGGTFCGADTCRRPRSIWQPEGTPCRRRGSARAALARGRARKRACVCNVDKTRAITRACSLHTVHTHNTHTQRTHTHTHNKHTRTCNESVSIAPLAPGSTCTVWLPAWATTTSPLDVKKGWLPP